MSDIVDMLRKPFRESKARADYFSEKEEYSKAISEYIVTIDKLTSLVEISVEGGSGSEESVINGSLALGILYDHIAFCYTGVQYYHQANAFLDKASQTYRSIRNSGVTLNRFSLESLDKQEGTVKKAKNTVQQLSQQDDGGLDSENDLRCFDFTSITDMGELPTSFMDLRITPSSRRVNSSSSTSNNDDKTVYLLLFFFVGGIILCFFSEWLLGIIFIVVSIIFASSLG